MERRVIKFSLVGAILVLILIVAAIIGIVVFTINVANQKNDNEDVENEYMVSGSYEGKFSSQNG